MWWFARNNKWLVSPLLKYLKYVSNTVKFHFLTCSTHEYKLCEWWGGRDNMHFGQHSIFCWKVKILRCWKSEIKKKYTRWQILLLFSLPLPLCNVKLISSLHQVWWSVPSVFRPHGVLPDLLNVFSTFLVIGFLCLCGTEQSKTSSFAGLWAFDIAVKSIEVWNTNITRNRDTV